MFEREVALPVPEGYVWPVATHFALYDHNGAFPLAWHELGVSCVISVADRRTTRQPPPGCYHYIGSVQDFVHAYPHPLGIVTSHVTCGPASVAASKRLRDRIIDGTYLSTCEEILWTIHLGSKAAAEQPATNAHHALGPPTFITNGTKHGGRRHKVFTWFSRNLESVPDGPDTPPHLMLPRLSGSTPEKRMLRRTETPLSLARSHAATSV